MLCCAGRRRQTTLGLRRRWRRLLYSCSMPCFLVFFIAAHKGIRTATFCRFFVHSFSCIFHNQYNTLWMITRSSSFISRSSLVFYMISLTLLVIFYLFVPLLAITGSPSSSSFLFCSFSCFVVAVMDDHVCRKRQNRTRSRWGKYEYYEYYERYSPLAVGS